MSVNPLPDMRRIRTNHALALIMKEAQAYIPEPEYSMFVSRLKAYMDKEGVCLVSDFDRNVYGLPPRDKWGWTEDELIALEECRVEELRRPRNKMVKGFRDGPVR
ncbi:MAG: hypothetical protein ACR2PR_08905 [Pseudohongiellaceae bacterium]